MFKIECNIFLWKMLPSMAQPTSFPFAFLFGRDSAQFAYWITKDLVGRSLLCSRALIKYSTKCYILSLPPLYCFSSPFQTSPNHLLSVCCVGIHHCVTPFQTPTDWLLSPLPSSLSILPLTPLSCRQILILHAETVVAFSMAAMVGMLYQKAGPSIAASLDERAVAIEETLSVAKADKIAELEAAIAEEKTVPSSLAAISEIFELNKEVAAMASEVQYRADLAENEAAVYKELNFLMQIENETKNAEKQLLIDQVVAGVLAEAGAQEGAILKQCVADLSALSASQ